jgi:hypothetical protein
VAGKDEAFVLSLAVGISVIYSGFLVAARASASHARDPVVAGASDTGAQT